MAFLDVNSRFLPVATPKVRKSDHPHIFIMSPSKGIASIHFETMHLSNELNNAAGFLNLALGFLADVAGLDDKRNLRDAALTEDLGVTERKEVEDDGLVGGSLLAQVLLTGLLGH
jgi:hypothetical protein